MSSLHDRGPHGDMDFADVFGGPPRRSSMHDLRRRGGGANSLDLPASARSNSSEKPVFGGTRMRSAGGGGSMDRRRRELGDDFFSDIFPGSESQCSSPRQSVGVERDVFAASLPGSRVNSPNRPVSSSFFTKFTKGMDHPTFASPAQDSLHNDEDESPFAYSLPSSPKSSTSSFPIRAVPSQDDLRNSPRSLYHHSAFSRLRSNSGDRKEPAHHGGSLEKDYGRTQASPDSYININQFHFSFYKWAGMGVSLVLPITPEEKSKTVRSFPIVVVHGVDLIDDEDDICTTTGKSRREIGSEAQKLSRADLHERKYSKNSTSMEGLSTMPRQTQAKKLQELFKQNVEGLGTDNVTTTEQSGTEGIKVPLGSAGVDSVEGQEEKVHGRTVKGKVKDFIKTFDPVGLPMQRAAFNSRESVSSVENKSKNTINSQMDEGYQAMEESNFKVSSNMNKSADASFKRKENIEPTTEPTSDASDSKTEDAVDPEHTRVDDIEECLVEHLPEDHYQVLLNDEEKDQIKISESKIREWSRGKEGNIRALLSTLQNVLWPESGWKTVRLVDIIEGAAVRRAYQKALLCLHPDKLQQRGAAIHQKYIAEKVFKIVQDAWTEFNAVTFG